MVAARGQQMDGGDASPGCSMTQSVAGRQPVQVAAVGDWVWLGLAWPEVACGISAFKGVPQMCDSPLPSPAGRKRRCGQGRSVLAGWLAELLGGRTA